MLVSERTFRDAARAFFLACKLTRRCQVLVLSRRRNEQIVINGGVLVITVVDIRDDKVRIGIDAPLEMSVHRREVQEAIDRENARGEGTC